MLRRTVLAAPFILGAASSVRAQQFVPKQPIKILVGYAPGGTADITARLAADFAAEADRPPHDGSLAALLRHLQSK
jgi:tripartite-type tricarboxylate transporter receptor subunit TctC